VGEVGLETWALERRVWPLEAGCDSFPWLLPMVSVKARAGVEVRMQRPAARAGRAMRAGGRRPNG
jgi:hypothetical protein